MCIGSYDYCRAEAESILEGQWVYYVEPTEDDGSDESDDGEGSACGDCVSRDEYTALLERVSALEASHGMLEITVNEVDSGVKEIASCAAAYLNETEPATTMEPEETSSAEPEEPEETTTAEPEPRNLMYYGSDLNCIEGRTFKVAYTDDENCGIRCIDDVECQYVTISRKVGAEWCVGCSIEPNVPNTNMRFDVYSVVVLVDDEPGRRRLSEIEVLRQENAALRAALKERL